MAFEAIFMDAGQGDATLLVYPDKSLVLVDCGSKKNADIVSGEIAMVLDRYLRQAPGNKLKALVLTHPDGDHYNLIDQLIIQPNTQVDFVVIGGKYYSNYTGLVSWLRGKNATILDSPHVNINPVQELSHLVNGAQRVETRILMANVGYDNNSWSIVLLVTYRSLNLLLMGDATAASEHAIEAAHLQQGSWLAQQLAAQGKLNALKVGHHGSNTSSSEDWVQSVQPQLAFVSSDTKEFGRYGTSIPRKEVLERILPAVNDDADEHYYVDYDSDIKEHVLEPPDPSDGTTKAMFTSLHRLKWYTNTKFKAYGTSWYLGIDDNDEYTVIPACGWADTQIRDIRPD